MSRGHWGMPLVAMKENPSGSFSMVHSRTFRKRSAFQEVRSFPKKPAPALVASERMLGLLLLSCEPEK